MEKIKGKNKYEDEDELEAELENPSEINKKESGLKEISGQATEGPLYNYSDYQMATIGEETDITETTMRKVMMIIMTEIMKKLQCY